MVFDTIYNYNIPNYCAIKENPVCDPIFCQNNMPDRVEYSLQSDSTFRSPDKTQYIFSTMGPSIYVMYPNGYATEVRVKNELRYKKGLTNCLENMNENATGIYIVDYMLFHRSIWSTPDFTTSITNRFRSLGFNFDSEQYQKEINALVNSVTRQNVYSCTQFRFRTVTFIPSEVLIQAKRIYSSSLGLVFGLGPLSEKTIHPASMEYIENHKDFISKIQNFVEIDIVDNSSNREYWTRVGNKVIKLEPTRNMQREEACHVSVSANDTMLFSNKSTLHDTAAVHGIYNSKEEAEREGNMDNKLKEMQYQNDLLRIQNDTTKLQQEIVKLRNENDKLALDKQRMAIEYKKLQVDLERVEVEKNKLALDKYKSEVEYELTKRKYYTDLNKMLLEVRHLKDKLTLFKYGAILDLIKKKMELDNSLKIKESKFNYEEFKSARESINDMQSVVATSLRMGKMLTEII